MDNLTIDVAFINEWGDWYRTRHAFITFEEFEFWFDRGVIKKHVNWDGYWWDESMGFFVDLINQ